MTDTNQESKKTSGGRRGIKILIGLTVGLLLLVLLAPTLLSTGPGKSIALGLAGGAVPGRITIDSLSLGWFAGQSIKGLVLADPEGKPVITVGELSTQASLLGVIRGNLGLGKTTLRNVVADFKIDEKGDSNLRRAVQAKKDDQKKEDQSSGSIKLPPSLAGVIEARNVRISITPATVAGISAEIDTLTAELPASGGGPITFALAGRLKQGDLSGELKGQGKAESLIAADGTLTGDKAKIDVDLTATGLPSAAIDALARQDGLLAAALGSKIDLAIKAGATAESQDLVVAASSPNVKLNLTGRVAREIFQLTAPATLSALLTPELMGKLTKDQVKLAAAVPIELNIEKLTSSIRGFSPDSIAARIALATGADAQIIGDAALGRIVLGKLNALIDSSNLAQDIAIRIAAPLTADAQPGKIAVQGTIANLFDARAKPRFDKIAANLAAAIEGLPVALLDRLADQKGLLIEALGATANLNAVAQSAGGGADKIALKLDIQTPKVQSQGLTVTYSDLITLDQPATIRAVVTPALASRYLKDQKLLKDVPVVLAISKFQTPRPRDKEQFLPPGKTILHATLTPDAVWLSGLPQIQTLRIDKCVLKLEGDTLAAPQITLNALLSQNDADGLLTLITGSRQTSISAGVSTTLNSEFKTGPVAAIAEIVSSQLNAKANVKLPGDFKSLAVADTTLKLIATPALLKHYDLLKPDQPRIKGNTTVDLAITQLDIPLGGTIDLAALKAAMSGSITPATSAAEEPIIVLFGSPFSFDLRNTDGKTVMLKIDSKQINADLTASILEGRMSLTRPAALNLTLTPQMLELLGATQKGKPTISGPTPLRLSIDKLDANVAPFDLAGMTASIKATIAKLELAGDEKLAGTWLSNTQADLQFNGPGSAAALKLNGLAAVPGQAVPGKLLIDASASKLFDDKKRLAIGAASIDAKTIEFDGLPVAFVEALSGQSGKLIPLLGPALRVTANANLVGGAGAVNLKAGSETLAADLGAKLGPMIELTRPASVKLRMSPAAYALWTHSNKGAQLAASMDIAATIHSLAIPKNKDDSLNIPAASADLQLSIPSMQLRDSPASQVAAAENLTVTAKSPGLGKTLDFKIDGSVRHATGNPGKIAATGTIKDLYTAEGKINSDALTALIDAQLTGVPGSVVDALAAGNGKIGAMLGASANAHVKTQLTKMQGPIDIVIDSTNLKASFPARIEGDNLLLTGNGAAELMVTEEMTDKLVDVPVLKEAVKSVEPVRLALDKTNFSVPIRNNTTPDGKYDLSKVNIDRGSLSLGRLLVRNNTEGIMGSMINIAVQLGTVGGLGFDPKDKTIPAWFGAMDFSFYKGALVMNRTDVLLGRDYQIATWGKVDIVGNYGTLYLGITERALRRVYAIRAFVDSPDYAETFEMKGPLDKIGPNKPEMIARLTFLTSAGVASNVGGKATGKTVDTIFKSAATIGAIIDATKNKDKKQMGTAAPKAKRPFPWDADPNFADPGPNPKNAQQTQQGQQRMANDPNQPAQQTPPAQQKSTTQEIFDLFKKKKK